MGFATSSDMRPIWSLYPSYRNAFHGIDPLCRRAGGDVRHRRDPSQRIGPGDDLEAAVLVFDQRRAAFHPVAAIHVADALLVANGRTVDVPADDALGAVTPRLGGERLFERADVIHGVLDLQLGPL